MMGQWQRAVADLRQTELMPPVLFVGTDCDSAHLIASMTFNSFKGSAITPWNGIGFVMYLCKRQVSHHSEFTAPFETIEAGVFVHVWTCAL